MNIKLRTIGASAIAFIIGGVLFVIVGMQAVAYFANRTAAEIVAPLIEPDPQKTVLNIARWTAENFDPNRKAPWYYQYSFILSHRVMPDFIRLPAGAVDILSGGGACNNISSILRLLYSAAELEAFQHDMVGPMGGHSAASVKLGDEWIFVDTYQGAVFADGGRLLSLERLKNLVGEGQDPEAMAIKLRPEPDLRFYRNLPATAHGMTWQPILTRVQMPLNDGMLRLGAIDNATHDVTAGAVKNSLTTHLDYFGPRYGRNFKFLFTADPVSAPNGFRLTFYATEEIDIDNLPESNASVSVKGKTISYMTQDPLVGIDLAYGNMRWTLRNIIRRKSWYDIDMITAEAL